MLSKVASIFRNNFSNQLSGVNLLSQKGVQVGMSASFSPPQVVENAAKILNKSPLEADFDEPTAHIKANPYNFGVVFYPNDVASLPTGHYMRFDIFKNNKQKSLRNAPTSGGFTASEKLAEYIKNGETSGVFRQLFNSNIKGNKLGITPFGMSQDQAFQDQPTGRLSGIQSRVNTHSFVEDTIILYTPPQVKTTYSTQYDQAETMGSGAMAGSGGFSPKGIVDFLSGAVDQTGMALREIGIQTAAGLPNAGDAAAARVKATGEAKNPNLEMAFKSVPFRKFEYNFEFSPRNLKEVDSVDKILKLFRYHMQPGLNSGSSSFFQVPSEFELTYMYINKQNSYIPRIARCVLTDMTIDQSPEGVFTTFRSDEKGAFPTATKLSLSFTETEIMTKAKIAEGF